MQGKWARRDWAVLELLSRCAVEGSGWRLGGVRGWLLYEDVDAALSVRVSEALPHLAALGLAERRDVRGPWRSRPIWLYRVTTAGLNLLAGRTKEPPPRLPPAGEDPDDAGTFFLPRRLWRGLRRLQTRTREGEGGGWLTLRQLASAGARLDSVDAEWLVRCALLEQERIPGASGRDTWQFRASAAGLRVHRTAPPSSLLVRVRMRDPAGPGPQP